MNNCGIDTFVDHHEVATAGQAEIGVGKNTMVAQADVAQWYKYLVRNIARQNGRVATFMPKPIYGDNGSGMHTHQSLWKDGQPLFFDADGYAASRSLRAGTPAACSATRAACWRSRRPPPTRTSGWCRASRLP